jgi:hypothetical protein
MTSVVCGAPHYLCTWKGQTWQNFTLHWFLTVHLYTSVHGIQFAPIIAWCNSVRMARISGCQNNWTEYISNKADMERFFQIIPVGTTINLIVCAFRSFIDPLWKSAVLNPRVKSNGLMHWNYPDFKEIYTVTVLFSNLAHMFRIYLMWIMTKNMRVSQKVGWRVNGNSDISTLAIHTLSIHTSFKYWLLGSYVHLKHWLPGRLSWFHFSLLTL